LPLQEEYMKTAILQSNYIPWKGVFDMINMVDTFVFLEDVDFTKRDWRTRNKIKSKNGDIWLRVPVKKSPRGTKIYEIEIDLNGWQEKHYRSITMSYAQSDHFKSYVDLLEHVYVERQWKSLSEMNQFIIKSIAALLNIETVFMNSVSLGSEGKADDKLIDICKKLGATHYLSGPAAKNYICPNKFMENDIRLEYIVYDYPEYPQPFGEFDHYVSVLDVLFNCGGQSAEYIFQGKKEIVF